MLLRNSHIFVDFSLFWKSWWTLKVITLPCVAQMSCPLIFSNTGPGGFLTLHINWKYYLWPLQCCCEIHIFLWNFSLFWKSCRTLNDITLPWVALMSCPLIYNNNDIGGFCDFNFNWKYYLWPLQCCCEIHIFLWNFSLFWKSCSTLKVITMPWVAQMSCPLKCNNTVLVVSVILILTENATSVIYNVVAKLTYFCGILHFFENHVGL